MSDDQGAPPELTPGLAEEKTEEIPRDDLEWARRLVDGREHVLHTPTRTIGRAHKLYDGRGALYTPPEQEHPTQAPVLELEPGRPGERGHSFVATPSAFVRLTEREGALYAAAQAVLSETLAKVAALGRAQGVPGPTALTLISCAVRAQAEELERGLRRMRDGG